MMLSYMKLRSSQELFRS